MEGNEVGDSVELLRGRLSRYHTLADELAQKHFKFIMGENNKRSWDEKSILFCTARIRDNTVNVIWQEVHWYGSKALNTRRMRKRSITKRRGGYGYTPSVLSKLAKTWEVELVLETERQLTEIRREVFFIAKAIGSLNKLLKAANAGETE